MSLSWMVFVSVWPASHRPYVDGSNNNSIFSQVFVYNGFGRIDQASPNQLLTKAIGLTLGSTRPGWHRLLSGVDGHDTAWLIPAALVALVACLLASRRRDDTAARRHRDVGNVAGRAADRVQREHDDQPVLPGRAVTRDRGAARDGRGARLGAARATGRRGAWSRPRSR